MPNRLAREASPYLRQHADNPVDWYPWGAEALARAVREDKPILLSVGYSACHWCHVMAHESFEDPEIARLMNERFVCVKVDREEMPDVDQVYQGALQIGGEPGGWPLTMFLLPDGTPFFGGTYFPKIDGFGRPGFGRLLVALSEAWARERPAVQEQARLLREGLGRLSRWGRGRANDPLGANTVDRAAATLVARIDRREGGFGEAPKFPQPKALELLLRGWRRLRRRGDVEAPQLLSAVTLTLRRMAEGGIYDHLGGGFARYATDSRWLVPHFEKMLYDNAQLLALYAAAHQAAPSSLFARVMRETAAWLARDLGAPEGGFYAARDADSEGVEGKYYVWTPEEVRAVVGADAGEVFCRCFGVVPGGNWSDPHGHGPAGSSILHVAEPPASEAEARLLDEVRAELRAARERRVPPLTDDKVLAGWNGLAIGGLAEAGRVLGDPALVESARRCAEFVLGRMRDGRGRLLRTYTGEGGPRLDGTLDDYAFVAEGLIALAEASGPEEGGGRWLEEAYRLTELSLELFFDDGEGVFYLTAAGDETPAPAAPSGPAEPAASAATPAPIIRPSSFHDGAIPSGLSVTIANLVRLGDAAREKRWLAIAERMLRLYHDRALAEPFGFANLLAALDLFQERPAEIVLAGEPSAALAAFDRAIASVYLPNRLLVHAPGDGDARAPDRKAPPWLAPLLAGKTPIDGHPAAYVCRDFTCAAPITDPAALARHLAV